MVYLWKSCFSRNNKPLTFPWNTHAYLIGHSLRQPVTGEDANPPCLWMAASCRCSLTVHFTVSRAFLQRIWPLFMATHATPLLWLFRPELVLAGTRRRVARTIHGLYSGIPFDIPPGLKEPGRRRLCPWQWFYKSGHILAWNAWEMEQTDT